MKRERYWVTICLWLTTVWFLAGVCPCPCPCAGAEAPASNPNAIPNAIPNANALSWTDSDGRSMQAELLAYNPDGGEMQFGKEDGLIYTFSAHKLNLESKFQLFKTPVYKAAVANRVMPMKPVWRLVGVGAGVYLVVQFVLFWFCNAALTFDESMGKALGGFLKYFGATFVLLFFLGLIGFGFFEYVPGDPPPAWMKWALGITAALSLFVWMWAVIGSYGMEWFRAIASFTLNLILWFALGVAVNAYGPKWLESEHANRMITKHVFVPMEMM